jgi:SAM-dependent methyltransferase
MPSPAASSQTVSSHANQKTATPPSPPDLAAIKRKQQATWSSGNFARVASRIVLSAEQLAESAGLPAGWRVLDVATGSGNAALAAARRGCEVVGVDYVPPLLEHGRLRAEAEMLDVQFKEGDAENIPFPDGSFDAVLSIYGVMFAPDHRRCASELARVCKPGGRIALASWTPDGFIAEMFALVGLYVPPVGTGVIPPIRWGDEAHLKDLFGPAIRSIQSRRQTFVMRYRSAEENVEFFRTYYGPTLKLFEAVGDAGREALARDMAAIVKKYDLNGGHTGPVAIRADYLETVIVRA